MIKLHKSTSGMGLSIVAAKVCIKHGYIYVCHSYTYILVYIRSNVCTFHMYILQGAGQDRLGIYIKSVVAGGAADAVSKCCVILYICYKHII